MREILEFVSYNLKQVGLDTRTLNGGIVLTGGGSQLKHLIQLTEYVTGLNARIGYPNEHLTTGHIDELSKPIYATCIGLILKGYNVYENSQNRLHSDPVFVVDTPGQSGVIIESEKDILGTPVPPIHKKKFKDFMDSIKHGLIDLFKEEEDKSL
jgi:cell division protein FtsA